MQLVSQKRRQLLNLVRRDHQLSHSQASGEIGNLLGEFISPEPQVHQTLPHRDPSVDRLASPRKPAEPHAVPALAHLDGRRAPSGGKACIFIKRPTGLPSGLPEGLIDRKRRKCLFDRSRSPSSKSSSILLPDGLDGDHSSYRLPDFLESLASTDTETTNQPATTAANNISICGANPAMAQAAAAAA